MRKFRFFNLTPDEVAYKLTVALKNQLEIIGGYQIIVVENRNSQIIEKMRQIKDSLIYKK
ncbi:MAG: hypothetical protein AAFV71_17060 [Cyanobacteria bacterium J06633_8]